MSLGKIAIYTHHVIGVGMVIAGGIFLFAVDGGEGVWLFLIPGGLLMIGVGIVFGRLERSPNWLIDGFLKRFAPELGHLEEIRRTGLRAHARIISVKQTGSSSTTVGVEALVEVNHPQRGVYQAKTKWSISLVAVPRVQPNSNVEVRINPQNPEDIVLVI
jgi:hypothetical protein